jgi:predicted enzyme related to lactoylglutathione lyase
VKLLNIRKVIITLKTCNHLKPEKMYHLKYIVTTIFFVFFIQLLTSCDNNTKTTIEQSDKNIITKKSNPVVYFEIPVNNIDRAIKFYKSVFDVNFDKDNIDNNEMALFPFADKNSGISGALVKGEIYKPTKDGVLIYFKTENIDKTLKLATSNGGKILYTKTDNGIGLVAEFEDTEGNRIALYQPKE